ncbi:hypothetical protein TWF718_004579 [Orbilia javanica]|uniref:Uncharacterized protein n=1 Tax=Orbilia javanica TaxID=47235 RepID=A0AAN8MXY9_9PEZI
MAAVVILPSIGPNGALSTRPPMHSLNRTTLIIGISHYQAGPSGHPYPMDRSPSYTSPTSPAESFNTSQNDYSSIPTSTASPTQALPAQSSPVYAPPIQTPQPQTLSPSLQSRLASLASRSGVAKVSLEPPLQAPPRHTFSNQSTGASVREKLIAIRRSQPDYKPPSASGTGFLRKKTVKITSNNEAQMATFKPKELSFLLGQEILQPTTGPGSDTECAAIVEALLDMGADVNVYKQAKGSLVSKMHLGRSDANAEIPARYIQDAAERGKINVIHVLASRGLRQASLNEAYQIAMRNANIDTIKVLLEYGADPNSSSTAFEQMVSSGYHDIARLILRSNTPISKDCLTRPLKGIIEMGYVDMVELLVAHGADLEYNNAEAIMAAAKLGRWDMLLKMVLNQVTPTYELSQIYLLSAVNSVMLANFEPSLRLILIEILLCVGARGEDISRALIQAVVEGDKSLMNMLIEFGVDVNYDGAAALRHAVSECQLDLVSILLTRPPIPEYLNLAVGDVPFASQTEENIKQLCSLLLSAGGVGDSAARLLVQSVRAGYNDLLHLLIDSGVSIEYNSAEALVHAITAVDTRKVKALLKGSLGPESASLAFAAIDMFLDETQLHEFMSLLLAKGAHGDPVNQALLNAVRQKKWTIINLLLSNNADAGYASGASLLHAVSEADEAMLDTLLRNPVSTETANIVFDTLRIDTKGLYPMAQKLITAGARGNPLSKLLVSAVERKNYTIVQLLLANGASVVYDGGASLKKAVQTGDDQLVKMVVPKCTNCSDGMAAMAAAFMLIDRLPDTARAAIMPIFLRFGLRGGSVSDTLIREINKTPINYAVVEILVKDGDADLSANGGMALKTAASHGDIRLVRILLEASPERSLVSSAVPLAMDVQSPSTRFDILEMLLTSGAEGDEVSAALVKTIRQHPEAVGQIDLLLNNGADVNFGAGEAIRVAFTSKQLSVLKKLAYRGASRENLSAVFQMAWDYNDAEWQYKVMEVILGAKLKGPVVDDALIRLVQQEGSEARALTLLLKHGASVNHASGAAIMHCIRRGFVDRLKLLLQQDPAPTVIHDALPMAMEQRDVNAKYGMVEAILQKQPEFEDINDALVRALRDESPSKELVALLLDNEASVLHEEGSPIKLAALGGHHDVLRILLEKTPHSSAQISAITTMVFKEAMTAGVWKTENGLETMKTLLVHGASGISVDKAFVTAAEEYENYPTAKRFVEALLRTPNANINREDGLCLKTAAQNANIELVELLLQGNPSKRTLSMAFPHIIASGTEEENLLALGRLFLADGLETDLNFQHPSFGPVFFGVLTKYPNFVEFYQLLIDAGASLENEVKVNFHSVTEGVTPLLWALLQEASTIETRVIKTFIDAGANVNFKSECSLTTPLMVAVQRHRRDVVFELIKAGASVTTEDQKGQTALLKACQEGQHDIVELLMVRNTSRNDGSLHEAAAFCHPDVVRLLIREGHHDPDFPSTRHNGRSALSELALEGDAMTNRERVKETVEALLDSGADLRLKTDNRSALFFGLDNKNPVEMTRLLLNAGLYKSINNDFNLYKNEKNVVYSLTMYVRKGLCQNKSPEVQEELYRLLKTFRADDRYYVDDPKVPQPIGYVGIPDYLSRIEEERQVVQRKIDHERLLQQARLRMEKEEATERERIRNTEYQAELVRQADRKAREESRVAQQRAAELAHIKEMNQQRQIMEDADKAKQLSHIQLMHEEEQQHKSFMNKEELKMIEFKVAAERKRQQEIEEATNLEHQRQIAYLKQWKGNLEAQKQLTGPGAYGGPVYGGPSVPPRGQLQWPHNKDEPD